VTPEHFELIYRACERAKSPAELQIEPIAWWRGLLVFGWMTGWRISEITSLEWADVNLETGTAITRASDNKGKRDEIVALHPIVVEHLRPLKAFHSNVFPWTGTRKQLLDRFHAIQAAAGLSVACKDQRPHTCTDACCRYGFHDIRRSFASMNAANMTREALQALMRHRSSLTTERYINFARQMNPAIANLHVPEVLKLNAVS
jgi:integrase